jgi:Uma2 family endonuclease
VDANNSTRYTYEDWAALDDSNRYELVDGKLIMMSAPLTERQDVAYEIARQLGGLDSEKYCVFPSPYGVRLFEDTVFQPDISVISDRSKIAIKGCEGAPDLIVEVMSGYNTKCDYDHLPVVKYLKYLEAGVREYWIAHPDSMTVSAFRLSDGKYVSTIFRKGEKACIEALDDFVIDLDLVFCNCIL